MSLNVSRRVDEPDRHELDITNLVWHEDILYSAGDDGKIKAWSPDLTKLYEVQAHTCSIYSLAASDSSLYSCSSDGTIKSWELKNLRIKKTLANDDKIEFWKIVYENGMLYAGDNEGNLKFFRDDEYIGAINIAEPVKDMLIDGNVSFTAKDTDLAITELKINGHLHYNTITTYCGRPPLTKIGKRLLAFVSREGKDILVHENSHPEMYKMFGKVEGAHELVINSMAGVVWDDHEYLFSGGWDKTLKKWKFDKMEVASDTSINLDIVINTIVTGSKGVVYAAGTEGHIFRLDVL